MSRPPLYLSQILAWADAHHERTGTWPRKDMPGVIAGTLDEKWQNVDMALRKGLRGLLAGSSLARLLAEHRGVRNHMGLPPLNVRQILGWVSAHFRRTGAWPAKNSGAIAEAPGETWLAVDQALKAGLRGLPGGSTLARFLFEWRDVRKRAEPPPLTEAQILRWADAHYQRTGAWPKAHSGPILEAPGETWLAVHTALHKGQRGLPGGSTLARLLDQERHVRNHKARPRLTVKQILAWADGHRRRTGCWPTRRSGPILNSRGETWASVAAALEQGLRGLPDASSLPRLLGEHRGVRHHLERPRLSEEQIRAWGRAHYQRTGRWPTRDSGAVAGVPGETWSAVDSALKKGSRGLRGGSSLCQLLGQSGE